jgi:hypothetical protein
VSAASAIPSRIFTGQLIRKTHRCCALLRARFRLRMSPWAVQKTSKNVVGMQHRART